VHAVGIVVAIISADDIAAAIAGLLAIGRRIGARDDGPLDPPSQSVIGGDGHDHARVGLAVIPIVAGGLIVVPAVERLALKLHMHNPLAA